MPGKAKLDIWMHRYSDQHEYNVVHTNDLGFAVKDSQISIDILKIKTNLRLRKKDHWIFILEKTPSVMKRAYCA